MALHLFLQPFFFPLVGGRGGTKYPANLRLYESHGLTCQKQPANLRDGVWNRPENCSQKCCGAAGCSFDQGLHMNQVSGTTAE